MYKFKDNDKQLMLKEIANYFEEEFDLELGIIASENALDFFTQLIGGKVYNIALDDVRIFYENYSANLQTDYFTLYRDMR
ncbi:MAG: DUF2164 family protein [Gudongella sp.]|jgi:uncharacterized protein (DUF2164 family)|nr:DUF2164 family protein [Gudongella sp.]